MARKYADLVKTKEKVIEDLKKSLVEAKTRISVTQGRYVVSRLLMQQQQMKNMGSRKPITTAECLPSQLQEEQCRMANTFRLARCPRSTVRDFVGIAELKTVDAKEHQLPHWFSETTSTGMSQTFATLSTNDDCHAEERRVLPLTLNPRLHEKECHPAQK